MSGDEATPPPVIRIVGGGQPTPEQAAALVAVLMSSGGTVEETPAPAPEWNRPERLHRRTLPAAGPGAWTLGLR